MKKIILRMPRGLKWENKPPKLKSLFHFRVLDTQRGQLLCVV